MSVTEPTEAQSTTGTVSGRASSDLEVLDLLAAYDRVLAASEREPLIAWVRVAPQRSVARRWRVERLPRPTWFLRFFVLWHITNATDELSRRLARRAALLDVSDREIADKAAVETFRSGIPPVHLRTALALVIVAAVVLGRLALQHASTVLSAVPAFQNLEQYRNFGKADLFTNAKPPPAVPVSAEAAKLFDRISDSVGPDVSALGKTLDALAGAHIIDIALLAVGLLFAVYVVARPVMPAFRMKRLLFNLDDQTEAWRVTTTARWHVSRRIGIYSREDRVFGALGGSRRRELPFDLIIPALLCCSLPLALGAFVLSRATSAVYGIYLPWIQWDYALEMGCVLLLVAGARLGWLLRTWCSRRQGQRATPRYPCQIELGDGCRLTVRDPLQVGAFALLVPYYTMTWWFLFNRCLCRMGTSGEIPSLGRRPSFSLLAFSPIGRNLLLPAAISFIRGIRRLRRAERARFVSVRSPSLRHQEAIGLAVVGVLLLELPLSGADMLLYPLPQLVGYFFRQWRVWIPLDIWLGFGLASALSAVTLGYLQSRLNSVMLQAGNPVPEGPERIVLEHSE